MTFTQVSNAPHHKWAMKPQGRTKPGLSWKGLAGDILLKTLAQRFLNSGGEFLLNCKALSLISDQSQCIGVNLAIQHDEEIELRSFYGKGVFIADGGFQSNLDLLKKHVCQYPELLKQRGAATGNGDGLLMAMQIGAKTTGMSSFYGHTLSKDALFIENLWPYPYLDNLVGSGIVVDANARRFVDEGKGGVYVANKIANSRKPDSTFVIFDGSTWNSTGKIGLIPPNPHIENEGGTVFSAPTIEELSKISNLPFHQLNLSVTDFNVCIANNAFSKSIAPSREFSKIKPQAIITPPFYALPMCVGITYTMGGLSVNQFSQVIHENGHTIEGLFAIGASAGSFEGGEEVTYVGGLIKGGVTAIASINYFYKSKSRNLKES
jgi:fumarate reductase flavoprotein subunit